MELLAIPAAISLVLWFALLALKAFVFGDAIFRPEGAYPAADKQTKNFWLLILGLALLIQILPMFSHPLGILNIASTVAALVYLVGVRPALREVGGGRSGGGRSDGPYGRW